MMEEMGAAYMAEGIVTLAGSRMYTSMADTDEVIDDALNRFENVFKNIHASELNPENKIMKGRYVIAHDVGTSSNKAVLIDVDGNILESATVEYGFQNPNPGWVEQSPEDYWKAIVNSTKKVMAHAGIKTSEILGIVYATQAMGIIPMGKDNNSPDE